MLPLLGIAARIVAPAVIRAVGSQFAKKATTSAVTGTVTRAATGGWKNVPKGAGAVGIPKNAVTRSKTGGWQNTPSTVNAGAKKSVVEKSPGMVKNVTKGAAAGVGIQAGISAGRSVTEFMQGVAGKGGQYDPNIQ